ncbi:hypothetical protein RBB75_10625 [Tunturibacter empetritectus]|uniref:Uncharacterized protein n=1 Tax=Tunturiibacter empetritectus TaxID=3069691 RepID=A0AAU7Z8G1_9BACT
MRLVFPFVLDSVPKCGRRRSVVAERTVCAGGEDFAGWRVVRLVAGEETRSREAGQDAEMAARHLVARHLVVSRAALKGCAAIGPGCVEQRSHGGVCLWR